MRIINSRADLEALSATDPAAYVAFLARLRASATIMTDVAERPAGYGTVEYEGPVIPPVWAERVDNAAIRKFGFNSVAELPD